MFHQYPLKHKEQTTSQIQLFALHTGGCKERFDVVFLLLSSELSVTVLIHFATKPRIMSRDELHEVEVQVRGNENQAQRGHQISMKDRDPTAMNDHVKVTDEPTTQANESV